MPDPANIPSRHILILTDRDWTHPQGGGTGTNLYGQVAQWLHWGHRVTVIAGDYPGAEPVQRPAPGLELHHMGTRLTVFPRAAWAVTRGLGRDADVILEVINGIAFFTPLWPGLRVPRVALCHHVHQEHYVNELGWRGRVASVVLERWPLRYLYRSTPFLTISESARDDLIALGVPARQIHVAYLGADAPPYEPAARAQRPTLLYLGRLKQYKRIEVVLDVLQAVPGAVLDIAGEGDHRAALEAEIDARGLRDRVTMHGFVDERRKAELYSRAWVALTASSAEGWGLSVMEAACFGTPSAALRTGGLTESIVDGETGILADDPAELARRVGALVASREDCEALGAAAQARARSFSWADTAAANLAVLDERATTTPPRLRDRLRASDSAKSGGLVLAALVNNVVGLAFTIAFARLLGVSGYGSLAALVSAFVILLVGGQALQVSAAREVAQGHLGDGRRPLLALASWTRTLVIAAIAAALGGALLRVPIAALLGVPRSPWAAAAIPLTAVLWLVLSLQRGVLQGRRDYGPVAASILLEGVTRLTFSLVLVLAGAGVTGAYLGTPLAFLCIAAGLGVLAARRGRATVPASASAAAAAEAAPPPALRSLVAGAWAPIAGLTLLALLQNLDVIVVRHQVSGNRAGSYAAAAVAAKAVIWVAVGAAVYLLPDASRRAAAGLDPRPALVRALAVLVAVAAPALAIFALAPHALLALVFTSHYTQASSALIMLGLAMTLLAVAYLTVQYMLALGRVRVLWVLGAVALVEPFLLSAGRFSLFSFASVVFGLQCVVASIVLTLGWRTRADIVSHSS